MKFCVIGLGRFGYQLATVLAEHGMEVVALDSDASIVASIRDKVTQSICMRVKDEASLKGIGIEEMDTVIVATGEDFAESILITALLKKRLHMPRVIARAINDIHKDILKLVGADQTILPEQEIGIKLADNLSSPFTDLFRLTLDFSVSQIIAPQRYVGKSVEEVLFYQNYSVTCIGVKKDDTIVSVGPDYIIQPKDRLIVAGNNDDLRRLTRL
jgi:trk system potassium uptake protein TrkA